MKFSLEKNSVSLDKSLRASILPALKSELSTVSPAAPDGDIVVWPYDFSSLCVFLYFMYFYLCLYTTLRSEGDKAGSQFVGTPTAVKQSQYKYYIQILF